MDLNQKGYKKLDVWHKADHLAHEVYLATRKFPREELFGITSQLRRAVLSIPTNVVEASGRQSKNETRQFANIALGSLAETEYLLEFCHKLGYLSEEEFTRFEKLRHHLGAVLWNFYKSLL